MVNDITGGRIVITTYKKGFRPGEKPGEIAKVVTKVVTPRAVRVRVRRGVPAKAIPRATLEQQREARRKAELEKLKSEMRTKEQSLSKDITKAKELKKDVDLRTQQFEHFNSRLKRWGIVVHEDGTVTKRVGAPETLEMQRYIKSAKGVLRERATATGRYNEYVRGQRFTERIQSYEMTYSAVASSEKIHEMRERAKKVREVAEIKPEELVWAPRFTPEAGRVLIKERVEEAYGVPALKKALVAREEERPAEFAKEFIKGFSVLPHAPVEAPVTTFAGLTGFGFGLAGKRGIAELERVTGRRLPEEQRQFALTALQFAGEWAAYAAIFKAPEMAAKAPKVKPIGEIGAIEIVKRKGRKVKLPKIPKLERAAPKPPTLKPITREYFGPGAEKYIRIVGKKVPKPPTLKPITMDHFGPPGAEKYIRIVGKKVPKPPTLKPITPREYLGPELGKYLKLKQIIKPKIVRPKVLEVDIERARKFFMVQEKLLEAPIKKIVKPAVKLAKVERLPYFEVAKPTKAEAESMRYLLGEMKAAQKVKILKVKPTVAKEILIPESYAQLAMGLKIFKPPVEKLIEEKPKLGKPVGAPRFDITGIYKLEEFAKELKVDIGRGPLAIPKAMTPTEKELAKTIAAGPKLGEYLGVKEKVVPALAYAMKPTMVEKQIKKQVEAIKVKPSMKEAAKTMAKTMTRMLVTPKAIPIQLQKMKAITAQRVKAITIQRMKTITAQRMKTIEAIEATRMAEAYKFFQPPPKLKPPEVKEPPPPRRWPWRWWEEPVIRKKPLWKMLGFRVLVRAPGKRVKGVWVPGEFEPVTKAVLPRIEALALGQKLVAVTAKRTFKIAPALGVPTAIKRLPRFKPEMFVRKGRTYVERTKFAIDTYGELQEITKKGIAASKRKASGLFPIFRGVKKRKRKTHRRKKR